MRYMITGGAGFIGSHIVDYLIKQNNKVLVFDNFSTGKKLFIKHHLNSPNFKLITGDLRNCRLLEKSLKNIDFVFHLAAHADVKLGFINHGIDHEQNLEMTMHVLEACYKNHVKNIAFSSTSSVYGDAKIHPTPESYPFQPTSLYGATKAACESYINTYASYYGMRSFIFRFVSFIGERYTHGIIYDLIKRARLNSQCIELFSDGSPKKSSVYIQDGIEAIFTVINKSKDQFSVYNIGHTEILTVKEIAKIILNQAGYPNIKNVWLGKESNWKGDNEFVSLSIKKIKKLGWNPKTSIKDGLKKTVIYLQDNPLLLTDLHKI